MVDEVINDKWVVSDLELHKRRRIASKRRRAKSSSTIKEGEVSNVKCI